MQIASVLLRTLSFTDGMRFGWADWNLTRLPKQNNSLFNPSLSLFTLLTLPSLHSLLSTWLPVVLLLKITRTISSLYWGDSNCIAVVFFHRTTPKTQYTGCSVHENNNGQAAFENPMYNTNAKAVEGKAVRFDPNLNTVCTMV